MSEKENPFEKGSLAWMLAEGDWSDLTIPEIAYVLHSSDQTISSTISYMRKSKKFDVRYKKRSSVIGEMEAGCAGRMRMDCAWSTRPRNRGVCWMEGEFPKRLRKLRERQRRKQYVVSELCGLSRGTIRRYERGEMKPSAEALVAIAEYFDVSVDYLLGRTDKQKMNK